MVRFGRADRGFNDSDMTLPSTEKVIIRWLARFALIPLCVYGLGVPIELLGHGSITLVADGWLPFELIGLSFCSMLAIIGGWSD